MTFGGGPLNNFVLQGWARMAETMREAPGQLGVVTAVSGLLTKQGVSIFGPEPNVPFAHEKVTKEVAEAQEEVEVLSHATGSGRVATYTVARERGAAQGVVLVFDLDQPSPEGAPRRTLRVLDDPDLAELGMREELCGREAELSSDGSLHWR
jgi:acetyl-CoA C-acetyltransferase